MATAVGKISFTGIGTSRDELLAQMDTLALEITNLVGGAPWLSFDDDVTKKYDPTAAIRDDQGFFYQATRTLAFQGPVVGTPTTNMPPISDGFSLQRGGQE